MRSVLLLSILLATSSAHAQLGGKSSLGGYIGMAIPTGEFDRTWGDNGMVLGGHFGFPLGPLPFQAGFSFGYGRMGTHTSVIPLSSPHIAATEADLRVRSRVLSYHPLLRLNPLRGKVRPYVDAMAGFRHFTTTTQVSAAGLDDPISRQRNASDVAFSTGWAAGIMVRMAKVLYVEARVERFDSGRATYVDPASVSVSDAGMVNFGTLNSSTDAVHVLLGLGLSF